MTTNAKHKSSIHLELGDIIQFETNDPFEDLDMVPMFIDYIDETRVRLISTETRARHIFEVHNHRLVGPQDADTFLDIRSVQLLSRSPEKGYARQNGLVENTWIEIHIRLSPSAPLYTIVGKIYALREDQISVQISSMPAELEGPQTLQIDFGYRGIPAELHIEQILIMEGNKETSANKSASMSKYVSPLIIPDFSLDDLEEITEEEISTTEQPVDVDFLNAQLIDDEVFEPIIQIRNVSKSKMRYSLENQVSNMLDEILADLPPEQRSQKVMERIYLGIQRYIELRREFSVFEDGVISRAKISSPFTRPLKDFMTSHPLAWIAYSVLLKRDLYVNNPSEINVDAMQDINSLVESKPPTNINNIYTRGNPRLRNSTIRSDVSTEGLVKYDSGNFGMTVDKCTDKSDFVDLYNAVVRQRYMAGEELSVDSIVVYPRIFQEYTRGWMPSTNIFGRVFYSQMDLYPSWFESKPNTKKKRADAVFPKYMMSNGKNSLYKKWEMCLKNDAAAKYRYTEFKHTDSVTDFDEFMTNVIPQTLDIIRMLQPSMPLSVQTSVHKVVQWLEPYGITIKDITFSHKKFIVTKCIRHIQFLLRDSRRKRGKRVRRQLKEEGEDVADTLLSEYLSDFGNSKFISVLRESIALFHDIDAADIKRSEVQIKALSGTNNGTNSNSLGKANVVKEYDSEDSLRLDNGVIELFCDPKYDDTPYFLKNMVISEDIQDVADYKEYMREVLTYQYDCGEFVTEQLLDAVVLGKRKVSKGEFAVIALENGKYAYYKYDSAKLSWVFSEASTEPPLVPTKADPEANKWLDKCTQRLMEKRTENFLKKVADNNPNVKFADIIDKYEALKTRSQTIEQYLYELEDEYFRRKDMRDVFFIQQSRKPSYVAYRMAMREKALVKQQSTDGTQVIQSPHLSLVYFILSLEDLQTQSTCLCNFKAKFCREAIPPAEDKYWLYCRDSSAKLLPTCIYELALAAKKSTSEYRAEMNRICRNQGVINDDGNAFVDKHSGFFLRKIDDVEDVVFDDHDRVVFAAAPLEPEDEEPKAVTAAAAPAKEDEMGQVLREILNRFQAILGFTEESLDVDFALQFSRELIVSHTKLYYNNTSVAAYNKFLLDNRKDIAKEPTYDKYMKGVYVSMVAVAVLIAVQTSVPRIVLKMNKTNPKNCVQKCISSRDAYPFSEDETKKEGIDCIVCVAKLVATSFFVNPSLVNEKLFHSYYVKQVIKMREVKMRYDIAREYIASMAQWGAPVAVSVAVNGKPDVAVNEWPDFMPPLVPFDIESPDTTNVCTAKGSARVISLYIVKCIQDIIRTKTPLLSTLANVPFLQNACCNDSVGNTPLEYFSAIGKNPAFDNAIRCGVRISALQRQHTFLSKPPAIYYVGRHPLVGLPKSFQPSDTLKYRAIFHYAQFNTNRLPNDLMPLQRMLQKPEGYLDTDSVELNVSRASDNLVKNRDAVYEEVMKVVRLRGLITTVTGAVSETNEEDDEESEEMLQGENLLRQLETKRTYLYNLVIKPFYDSININSGNNELTQFLEKLDSIVGTPSMERVRFLQNCIYAMTRYLPAIVCHNGVTWSEKDKMPVIPEHWALFAHHSARIEDAVVRDDSTFKKYNRNEVIESMMLASDAFFLEKCGKVYRRNVESPPNASSIPELHALTRHGFYIVLDEYIKLACKSGDTFKWCISKRGVRGMDEMTITEDMADDNRVLWNMLKDVVDYFSVVNSQLMIDYQTIITKMRAVRTAEKKTVTDKFKVMSNEDRRVMNMFKKYKLEEWNVTDINKYGSNTFSVGEGITAGAPVTDGGLPVTEGGEDGGEDAGEDETLLGGAEQFEENE